MSPEELAVRSGVVSADVLEIEGLENDLTVFYSLRDVQKFCRALGIRPIELFGDDVAEPAVCVEVLVRRVHEECRSRGITLAQFDDGVGGCLSECIEPPERLLSDMKVIGLQWLCQELRMDWRRVLVNL